MGFVRAVLKKDLEPGKMLGIEVDGKKILLANLAGTYYAIGNRCTHRGCMLSDGKREGENIRCPCHRSVFDVKTGNVLKGPAKKPEPVFQVKVEGDQVLANV